MARLLILLFALALLVLLAYPSCRRRDLADDALPAEDLAAAITSLALRTPRSRLASLRYPSPRKPLRLMRRVLHSRLHWSALSLLREHQRDLALLLLTLAQDMRHPPRLPADESGTPRMRLLANVLTRYDHACDADALYHALSLWQDVSATTCPERMALPLCMRAAIVQKLQALLQEMHQALIQAQRGAHLARRLSRIRRPERALATCIITPALADALVHHLRKRGLNDLLAVLEDHLHASGSSIAELAASHARSQSRWSEILLQCQRDLHTLAHLNWSQAEEVADPLHQLLMKDPSGVYPQMTLASRTAYRQRAAHLASAFHTDESRLVRGVLQLCAIPEKDGLLDHVGFYLLETDGMQALHRHLKASRGAWFYLLRRHHARLQRTIACLVGIICALLILHRGYSLWLLPPLLLTVMQGVRFALRHLWPAPDAPVPQLAIVEASPQPRTLVVMPAVLHARSDAVPAVRRLLLASHAMPKGAVDLLLLGDYADHLTATAGEDAAIVYAAERAIAALNAHQQERTFYFLQRSRSYDSRLHRYTGRSGLHGALADIRQLLAEGSCPDTFDAATIPPESLRRRYAYMLVVTPDVSLPPDFLPPLLGALEHPLNRRRATMAKPLFHADPESLRTHIGQMHHRTLHHGGCWLMDPVRLQDQVENIDPDRLSALLLEELGGCITVPASRAYPSAPSALFPWCMEISHRAHMLWRQLAWLLPWQSAQQGVESSPLPRAGRRRLWHALCSFLIAPAQLFALFYAALKGDVLFFLLALLLPDLPLLFSLDRSTPLRLLTHWGLVPLRAFIRLDGILRALWLRLFRREFPHPLPETFPTLESWSQSLCALGLAAISLTTAPLFMPGLILAGLFACFPLIHTHLDRPLHHTPPLSEDMRTSLDDMAHATWHYFEEVCQTSGCGLPPASLQLKPWRGLSDVLYPDDAGLYLLACLCARELSLVDSSIMAERISRAVDALEQLPLWHGLPYAQYDAATLTPASTRVDTQRSGLMCLCLLCAAQGLRARLAELEPVHHPLPARLDALAQGMALHRLYDPAAALFHFGLDTQTETLDPRLHHLYASPALLTSFAAVMLGQIPPEHLRQLDRTRVRAQGRAVLCSPEGSAVDYLLPLLFLPLIPGSDTARTLHAFLRAQRLNDHQGMHGAAPCAVWQFDRQMHYQQRPGGLSAFALNAMPPSNAVAPYAAALGLPFEPASAHDNLMRLRSHGMMGRLGFFDALDFDPARLPDGADSEILQCHLSSHQAILLCSLCNALTAGYLTRTLSAMPAASACALLLRIPCGPAPMLPSALLHSAAEAAPREPSFRRNGRRDILPPDTHIIGTSEASLTLSAWGCGVMRSRGLDLTRFTGAPGSIEGLQFYLGFEQRFIRLGDDTADTEVVFAEGSIRLTQRISGLQCTLSVLTDAASNTFIHTLEIINLTGQERFLEAADCLIPGFQHAPLTLRADRPLDRVLMLRAPHQDQTLCHVLTTIDPLITLHAHTDLSAFSADQQLRAPLSLQSPAADLFSPAPAAPCAGFRARFSLGPRGRTTLVLTTRLLRPGETFSLDSLTPRATDLPSLLTLSRLSCRAVSDALSMSQAQAALVSKAAGFMLHHSLPHQGAVTPLALPPSALTDIQLDPTLPLMLLMMYTPAALPLMHAAADVIGWLNLSGQDAQLCILFMSSEAETARKCAVSALSASPARDFIHMHMTADLPDGLRETLEAHARLLLYEDAGSLEAQLNALCVPLSPTPALLPPDPLPLPEETLRFVQAHGGWQEQADHYVLRLAPDEAPPCWHAVLSAQDVTSRHAPDGTAQLMQSGATLCREYPLWLQTPEGCFPLLSPAAFRRVEVSPSQILWQCAGHGVDAALTASTVPDSHFHLRALRLKNLTTRPLSLTLTLAVDFGPCACPSTLPFGASALRPDLSEPLYLAMPEHQPQVDIMSTAAFLGSSIVPAGLTAAPEDTGTLVRLSLPLTLKAGSNLTISWIIGMGSTIDVVESLLSHLRQQGISALLRQHQRSWAQQLSCLTVSTPEPALDLLLNHLLPCQALQPPTGPLRLLPLTDPEQARSAWLHATAMPDADLFTRLMMIFDLLAMIHCTGDPSILHQPAPHQPSLHFMCIQTLSSVQLGQHGLPLTAADALGVTESVLLGLMLLHALQRYTPFCSAEESADMLDTAQRLTQAIHQHGWDGAWYRRGFTATGLPIGSADTPWGKIDGMTQAWAYLALGDTPHTRQALNAAWQMLWDPAVNVLHTLTPPFDMLQDPSAPTALPPGIGQNGGQDALTSVCMLQALIAAGQWDAAWMLLHALNPVTKPAAQVEPWLLPESWDAHGLALRPDDRGVCALLDRTALSGLLGFDLQGDMLFPAAHVPPSWAFFSLTLHRGTSTWHILFSRSEGLLTLDGTPISDGCIPLTNDGRIHQIRVPLPG